jgi:hypothetical protein
MAASPQWLADERRAVPHRDPTAGQREDELYRVAVEKTDARHVEAQRRFPVEGGIAGAEQLPGPGADDPAFEAEARRSTFSRDLWDPQHVEPSTLLT